MVILNGLGPEYEPLGDIIEEHGRRQSSAWIWRETLLLLASASARLVCGACRWQAARALLTGWGTLLLFFALFGDRVADGVAGAIWGWDRQTAYGTSVWWPFRVTAAAMSYSGFALAAAVVARTHRRHPVPMLLAFIASALVVLGAFALYMEWRAAPLALPHPLFFIVSVSLPYHWRAGFLAVPLVMGMTGLLAVRRRAAA
jgi:hypothetical protein